MRVFSSELFGNRVWSMSVVTDNVVRLASLILVTCPLAIPNGSHAGEPPKGFRSLLGVVPQLRRTRRRAAARIRLRSMFRDPKRSGHSLSCPSLKKRICSRKGGSTVEVHALQEELTSAASLRR